VKTLGNVSFSMQAPRHSVWPFWEDYFPGLHETGPLSKKGQLCLDNKKSS